MISGGGTQRPFVGSPILDYTKIFFVLFLQSLVLCVGYVFPASDPTLELKVPAKILILDGIPAVNEGGPAPLQWAYFPEWFKMALFQKNFSSGDF